MIKTDIHFFSVDSVPLILQFLMDRGVKFESHKAIASRDVRDVESICPSNCVILKLKYNV